MAETLTFVAIVLAVASATLAIASFVFSWVSFRNTTQMQIDSQAILAQVAQKVEVIADRTSRQMDRAWDYFTAPASPATAAAAEQIAERDEELRSHIIEEARREVGAAIGSFGLQPDTLQAMQEQIESLIERSADRGRILEASQRLLLDIGQIELEVRRVLQSQGITLVQGLAHTMLLDAVKGLLPEAGWDDLSTLLRFRAQGQHTDLDVPDAEVRDLLERSDRLLRYLRSWRGHK